MNINRSQIRGYRLHVHHLDSELSESRMIEAVGVCGLQNSPPGAWETALLNRLEHCSIQGLRRALYQEKSLLQAWSYRGVPVVFPTAQSEVFLSPLVAQEGEQPWIYTRGITGALEFLQMSFDDLLTRVTEAITYLDSYTIKSKEMLDQTLAEIVGHDLPEEKRGVWCAPSMYGNPQKQTVGGAAVSFLLRPCSFLSMVVFGEREGVSPTFTSYKNWIGDSPERLLDPDKKLVRKFLHCYGPTTVDCLMAWLGCSPKQARRLWNTISEEMEPVQVAGKTCFVLSADRESLKNAGQNGDKLLLLGAHDPYLDMKDRTVILENQSFHKVVWKTVANPGVILKGGRIVGIWKSKTMKEKLDISMTIWETTLDSEQRLLKRLGEKYAAFRQLALRTCTIEHR